MDEHERKELTKAVRVTDDLLARIAAVQEPWLHGPFDKASEPAMRAALEKELGAELVDFKDITGANIEAHAPGIRCYQFKLGERTIQVNVGQTDMKQVQQHLSG